MGSIHSGAHSSKCLVEDCLSLDLAWLMRLGPIRDGQAGSGEVVWSYGTERVARIRFRLDFRRSDKARLILNYALAQSDGSYKPTTQIFALTSTEQHFGGRRWWMRCPVTGQRVRTLHLPMGSDRFVGRNAAGLAYRVERLSHFDRPFEKRFRAQRRLGGAQGLGAGLERPKGMWCRTYSRHLSRFAQLDAVCAEKIANLIEPVPGTQFGFNAPRGG